MSKELKALAEAALPKCCGERIPTGVEYGGQQEMMCCEAWQEGEVTVSAFDLLQLIAGHEALLAERDALEAQVNALHRGIKAKLPGRRLVPVGSGALHAEQNYCYRRGWKEGVAALRSQIRAALQGAQP